MNSNSNPSNIAPTHPYYQQHLLGIDFGEKVTGLAVFCPGRDPWPQPYGRCLGSWPDMIKAIQEVVAQENIGHLVIGLPLLPDGKEGTQAAKVRRFAAALAVALPQCPIVFHDETLTTEEAIYRMQQSPRYNFKVQWKELDAWSTAIILEDFVRQA